MKAAGSDECVFSQIFAKRALAKLPRGSPEWIRAEDIANYKAPT